MEKSFNLLNATSMSCMVALDLLLAAAAPTQVAAQIAPFKGTVKLDVRDSKADWNPYIRKKAPAGSPNILFVLYDDTAWLPGHHTEEGSICQRWINLLLME